MRDVTYDEDRHQLRTGARPQVMATLRNLAISLIRTTYVWPRHHRHRLSQPGHDPKTHQRHQTPNNPLTSDFAEPLT